MTIGRPVDLPPETRYAEHDGHQLAYQRFGSGSDRLVLMNSAAGHLGLLWTDAGFSDTLERLARGFDVVMFEQLGLGMSDPLTHISSIEAQAEEIASVMDAVGWQSASIAALFTTGLAASMFAAHSPDRVERLVLFSAFSQGFRSAPHDQLVGWESPEQLSEYGQWWEQMIASWGSGASLEMFYPHLSSKRNRRSWGMLERSSASPAIIRALSEVNQAADVREAMRAVRAPTLVLYPAGAMLPEGVVRATAELFPVGSFEMLPEPAEFSEAFEGFRRAIERFVLGAADSPSTDRALMTVLFTDIVSSTEQATLLGDAAWRELLVKHERSVRGLVEDAGGRVVKFIGDGSLSTFPGPARAIRCAERIEAEAEGLGLEVRAGLHTGECEVIEDDVAGLAVHIAARVSGKAGAGEVLVSRTVRDLIAGSGIELDSRGEHALKGVDGEWELFAVGAATGALPAPDQERALSATDRLTLTAARRAPRLLRAVGWLGGGGRRS